MSHLRHQVHEMDTETRRIQRIYEKNPRKLSGIIVAIFHQKGRGTSMKRRLGGALIALAFVFGVAAATSVTANAQWRNRGYGNGGYNNQQIQQGYQYGVSTGASDAQRRQGYSPQ